MNNVFFFHTINNIGGVETMFWELAKEYHKNYDITVYYVNGDPDQIKRLRRYVNVIKYNGEEVVCKRAFFNYNLEPFLSHVKAEICFEIIHADFKLQKNIAPHVDPRIDIYLAVSQSVANSFYDVTGVKCEICPNPLNLEKVKNPPMFICAAQRMTSEKGGHRIKALINRLDMSDIKYYMLIFTNDKLQIESPNVCQMSPRLDIRPFIYGCDLFVAVSDSEGRCYSVGEKLGYGTGKLLITPVSSFYEQGANENNSIVMNFDMSNLDDVIDQIKKYSETITKRKTFDPVKCKDFWDKYLIKSKPNYKPWKYYIVETTDIWRKYNVFNTDLKCIPPSGIRYEVDSERLNVLLNYEYGATVKVIKEKDG